MKNLYEWVPDNCQWCILVALLTVTMVVGYYLLRQGKPLETEELPHGILEIEVPWSGERASEVVGLWGDDLVRAAKTQVMWDFLFLVLYPVALSFACALFAGSGTGKLAMLGIVVSWGVLLAAPLDAIENVAILKMLSGSFGSPIPQIATIAATVKFTLVFGAVGYLAIGSLRALTDCVTSCSTGR